LFEETADEASFVDTLDFSIIDSSFVCVGRQGMKIVINKQELEEHVINLLKTIPGNKLFYPFYCLDCASEADAICDIKCVHHRTMEHTSLWCAIGDSNDLPPLT
jgi:carbamoyl-phosphate synthase large subunit